MLDHNILNWSFKLIICEISFNDAICLIFCTSIIMAEGRVVDKALMDYVLLPRRMLGRLLDVKVWRGEGGDCLTIFCWKLG